MSDPTLVIIAGSIVGAVQVISLAVIKAWQDRNHAAVQKSIDVLTEQTDGKLNELTQAVKGQATAEGNLAGRAEVRAEHREDAKP